MEKNLQDTDTKACSPDEIRKIINEMPEDIVVSIDLEEVISGAKEERK